MTGFSALTEWYLRQCNGEWEHSFGARIETLDNPGWSVEIDLIGTPLEGLAIGPYKTEGEDSTWIFYKSDGKKFFGCSDPKSLDNLLQYFGRVAHISDSPSHP